MPIYSYACDNCGKEEMVVKSLSEYDRLEPCPVCDESMRRDIAADAPHACSRGRPYAKPIHSDSLGMAPSQVAEHRRLFPYIEIDSQCRPVFKNYLDHKKYLEATGFCNRRPKVRLHQKVKHKRLQEERCSQSSMRK